MFNSTKHLTRVKSLKQENFNKIKLGFFAKILVFFVCFFVFSSANFFGYVNASDYGIFVSLCMLQNNIFSVVLSFVSSAVLIGASVWKLVFCTITIVVTISVSVICKIKNVSYKFYIIPSTCFILSLINCFLNLGDLYNCMLSSALNIIACLSFTVFYQVLLQRRLNLKLQTDEIICFCVILGLFFCGLNNINVFVFDLVKFVGFILVLFSSIILPLSGTMLIALFGGFGASLANGNVGYVVLFSLVAIFNYVAKDYNKIFLCISVLCVDLIINLFFNLFSLSIYFSLIPTLCSLTIFLIISKKQINNLKNLLFLDGQNLGVKAIFDNDKIFLSNKLLSASEAFFEMDKSFRGLLQNKLDENSSKIMVCNEILRENCENCENRIRCVKNFDREIRNVFKQLTDIGFEKGKITLVDLPAYLTNRCVKVNSVVNSYNILLNKYKYFSKQKNNLDYSKLLVADQLKGISAILKRLAQETKKEIYLNSKVQETIKENLIYCNIVPLEVICFEKDAKTNVVEVVLRNSDFDAEKIKEILHKVYKTKMILTKAQSLDGGNSICAKFVTAPTFDVAVGICQASKGGEEVCGDTFTSTKLNENKFLFGVCDGMGHGEVANKTSEVAINIIENFYKVGFDNETILTSVNSLLCMQQSETFSALDVGVIDLKTGEVDFIKQGATSSYIVSKNKIFKIEGSGLPLGILSEVKIKTIKTVLTPEDFVIVISDGIIDSFKNEENFEEILHKITSRNPQEIAEKILNMAKQNVKNYPSDDMTVVVTKLFYY